MIKYDDLSIAHTHLHTNHNETAYAYADSATAISQVSEVTLLSPCFGSSVVYMTDSAVFVPISLLLLNYTLEHTTA